MKNLLSTLYIHSDHLSAGRAKNEQGKTEKLGGYLVQTLKH